jgi:peroxiredoxin
MAIQYGAADSNEQATAKRVAYLIGPDGRIQHVWPKASPQSFAAEVLAHL